MNNVFGAGNFTAYTSYAGATPASIFNPSNRFVFLEGGASTDINWLAYLSGNASTILNWVNSGGALLLMSAGWDPGTYTLGHGNLRQDNYLNASPSGTLTRAGTAAFTFEPTLTTQSGNYLAHDFVTGTGLTVHGR